MRPGEQFGRIRRTKRAEIWRTMRNRLIRVQLRTILCFCLCGGLSVGVDGGSGERVRMQMRVTGVQNGCQERRADWSL